ncbi:LCP family protein [Anaeromicropila populeti]|uniref:Regulatory protein MsrR n=1 Tax=Anaeromicropila populeti TaxID=37658 RepID=A0A1I6KQH5_9FIRM|nr:LCP family protein [Anaeromicropila populeti]SFR93483.1 transcriptional attenuator, LytR family [Anaeromicropila populeti]
MNQSTKNSQPNHGVSRKKKKSRKVLLIKRIVLVAFLMLAVVSGHVAARINHSMEEVLNLVERDPATDLSTVEVDSDNLVSDDKIINILLIGSDKRGSWKETGRSDSVMIATLDNKNKRIKLTSIMRDLYITIPSYGENRFNAAYSFGGVSLVYQTIADNFDLKLDGYVVVDFEAFKKVINIIGGVEIELTDAEQEYLVTHYKSGTVHELVPGVNNMDGNQALAYSRIRQDAKADFGRTERQRKVLAAIFKKAKSMPLSDLVELAKEIVQNVSTDLTNDEIISYMKSVLLLGTTELDQMRIPVDNSFRNERIGGKAVLVPDPDLEENKRALHDFIFLYNGSDR